MWTRKLKVEGIFLDLDGTIVDSKEAYLEALETAFAVLGQKTVDTRLVTEIPKRLEQNMQIADLIGNIDPKKFLEVYLDAYYRATCTKAKPIPNVSEALKRLSEKAKLAVVTMRRVSKVKIIEELERIGLAEYFQNVVTALDTRNPKPSPEALTNCATQLDIKTRDCVFVGDSVVDIRAGKNAGTKTVAVLSGIFSRKELELEKPDLILESVE